MGTLSLAGFVYALYISEIGLDEARTLVFTLLVWTQLFQAGIWRSDVKTQIDLGIFTNRPLIAAMVISMTLQIVIVIFEPLRDVFGVTELRLQDWIVAAALALLPVPLLEWIKKR